MDLPIRKGLAFRLFEVDRVWSEHDYSQFASSQFDNLRRPEFEGLRLRTGLVFAGVARSP